MRVIRGKRLYLNSRQDLAICCGTIWYNTVSLASIDLREGKKTCLKLTRNAVKIDKYNNRSTRRCVVHVALHCRRKCKVICATCFRITPASDILSQHIQASSAGVQYGLICAATVIWKLIIGLQYIYSLVRTLRRTCGMYINECSGAKVCTLVCTTIITWNNTDNVI